MNRWAAALVLVTVVAGCTSAPPAVRVVGTVAADVQRVAAPALAIPAMNLDAGFAGNTGATNPATGKAGPLLSGAAASYGLGTTVRIASLAVAQGDRVRAGQVLAGLDDRLLRAALNMAKADHAVAQAQVGLLGQAIDDTHDAAAEIADKKTEVKDAISQLTTTRDKLLKTRAELKANLAKARAGLKEIDDAIAQLPPGVPVPDELEAKRTELVAAIAKMESGLKEIDQALPKLNDGLATAKDGLGKLTDAAADVAEARNQLTDLKELAEIAATVSGVPVESAAVQLALAQITAPTDGVVVEIAAVGDILAAGATVATIREDSASTVTAWLSPAQLAQVCVGDAVTLTGDWMRTGVPGRLSRLGQRADYPPTSVATDEVHLIRAVEVEFRAEEQLPAGLPVQIDIDGCRLGAAESETR